MRSTSALLAALVSVGALAPVQAMAETSVTIGWFGGNWGDAFNACVAEPFTKATGIKVVPEVGTSTVNLAKLEQQKASPVLDAVWMDGGISELAMAAGVLDELRPAEIPNMKDLLPEGLYSHQGATFAASTGFYALGIAYNTQRIKTAPTSWNDLWSGDFADAVTFPSPANALGVPTIYFMNQVLTPGAGMDATFAKLKELHAGLFFDSSGAAANAFQTEEVVIGAYNNAPTWDLNSKGVPLSFVIPKEGAWGGDVRLHLVKGAPHPEAARKFIDQALTKEAASCLATRLYLGPSIKDTPVSAEAARKLPWGENGSVKDLHMLDWWQVNAQRASLVERWNREIAHR